MAYAAAYADGECLINTCTADDYAKMDEANANKIMEKNNEREDQITLAKSRAHKQKLMATSMDNFSKHLAKSKSLLQELQEKKSPVNDVYATIKVHEIVQGLTPEHFKKMDKEKALEFRKKLDLFTQEENQLKEGELFMGMTDQEIMVNKSEWIALGLM